MKYLFFLPIIFFVGCSSTGKKQNTIPPSISTGLVIESLTETKNELEKAGEANSKVAENIEKALTLAERLDVLLDKIEKEQQKLKDKVVIKPIE